MFFLNFEGKIINSSEIEFVDIEFETYTTPHKAWKRYDQTEYFCKLVAYLKSGRKIVLKTTSGISGQRDIEIYKNQFNEMLQYAECGINYNELYDYDEELQNKAKTEYGWR